MTIRSLFIAFVLMSSVRVSAQQDQPSLTCPATEQAVRDVEHPGVGLLFTLAIWLRWTSSSTMIPSVPTTAGRAGEIASVWQRSSGPKAISIPASEQPGDFRVVFTSGITILNFTRHWTD
jgi:hypothetical protein